MKILIRFTSDSDPDIGWSIDWPEGQTLVLPDIGDYASMYEKGRRKVLWRHFDYNNQDKSLDVELRLE